MQYLRQSTASQEISLGYFLDSTDGDTEETALTIANTDIKIRKHGGTTLINKTSGGATHISNGIYQATLDATDTNTAGMLEIYVHVTGALAVKSVYTVLTATAFDSLLTGTFNNLGGVAQTADNDTKISLIPTTPMRGTDSANTATPLTAAGVRSAVGLATANMDTQFSASVTATGFATPTNITAGTISTVTNLTNLPSIPANWITAAGIAASAMDGKGDWNIGKTGYSITQTFPTNFSSMVISGAGAVDALTQGYMNSLLTEVTAGRIAGNFDVFFENADALTAQVVDDVGGAGGSADWTASEQNEIRGRLGITGTTAAGGNTPTLSLQSTADAIETDTQDIQTRLPASLVGGLMSSDVTAISTDTGAADNLELMYDGTGYTDDTAPASRSQVGSLSSGSAAISTVSTSATVTTGTETLTFAVTDQLDGILHEVADVANTTEFYYEFSVGGNGVPVEFVWDGYAQSNGDSYIVSAYNWGGATFDQIGTISGTNGTTIVNEVFQALNSHVGTGANLGLVRLQFTSTTGTHFTTDRVICSYAVVSNSVGYSQGRVWVNTAFGTAGTESFINGTADNQVLTFADALTIAGNIGLKEYNVSTESTLTLAANLNDSIVYGVGYTLNFGGFDCGDTHFYHASPVNGVVTAAIGHVDLLDSIVNNVTINEFHFTRCTFTGTVTLGTVGGDIRIVDCRSGIAGSGTPIFDFGTSTVNHNVFFANYQNGIEIRNFNTTTGGGTDLLSLSGTGQIIIASTCDGGTINLRGQWKVTDNSGGAVTIAYDDVATNAISILADTADMQPKLGTPSADISADIANLPTVSEFNTRTPTAAQLAYMANNAATGLPVTFTTSGGSTTSAVLNLVDGSAGSATNDQYNGRLLVFTDGTLKGVVTDITSYVGSTTTATITAIPTAPTASHNARLI